MCPYVVYNVDSITPQQGRPSHRIRFCVQSRDINVVDSGTLGLPSVTSQWKGRSIPDNSDTSVVMLCGRNNNHRILQHIKLHTKKHRIAIFTELDKNSRNLLDGRTCVMAKATRKR
ncbi:MAG: hypothetical protein C0600_11255 [Ignavibacteria bacterium]|nr:MAG: hypothetical protein C0600_11255 [Ignavibacteria bacterium]